MKYLLIFILRIYKIFLSPILVSVLGHGCRYSPTCSQYAIDSINKYGILNGGKKSLKRILSCNSFTKLESTF